MTPTTKIITIDGPAASGKSSVSRLLASRLDFKWVSTGAFYRGLAFVATQEKIDLDDTAKLIQLAANPIWQVKMEDEQTRVVYNSKDVTLMVMSEENGSRASKMSQNPKVREALLQNQRDCARGIKGLVAEGRDCGTVVFPDAILKVFLTASQEERAARRAKEQNLNYEDTHSKQTQRDQQDTTRAAAPMQAASDAKVVDSNGLQLMDVVDRIHGWALAALAENS